MPVTLATLTDQIRTVTYDGSFRSIFYQGVYDAAGLTGSGPCEPGLPWWTTGDPALGGIGAADIDLPDIMADPDLGDWTFMQVSLQVIGGTNVAWNCPCAAGCEFSDGSIDGKVLLASDDSLLTAVAEVTLPPVLYPAESTNFILGSLFKFYSGDPAHPLDFANGISAPPRVYFKVRAGGQHIHLTFQTFVWLSYVDLTPPPPPPPPPPWPTPTTPVKPACGTFTPW